MNKAKLTGTDKAQGSPIFRSIFELSRPIKGCKRIIVCINNVDSYYIIFHWKNNQGIHGKELYYFKGILEEKFDAYSVVQKYMSGN